MRLYEIIKENASSGSTAAGAVATVVKPQVTTKKGKTLFGGDMDDHPSYGDTVNIAVIRRPKSYYDG